MFLKKQIFSGVGGLEKSKHTKQRGVVRGEILSFKKR